MTRSEWPAASHARYAVIVLMVAYLFSYVDRQILSMLVGPIKADLGLTDTELSLLHGLAFALFYTVFGIWPIGTWADKGNRRNIIAGGVFLWSLMTALCGRMTSFAGLFAARVGVGVGEAALTPTAYSMLADYFPPEKRGRALGLFSMGVYFGIGVAIMVTGALVQYVSSLPPIDLPLIGEVRGWQIPFLLLGPPGILVALWMMTVQEPPRRGTIAELPSFGAVISHLLAHRSFYLNFFFGVSCLTLLFNGIAFWFPAHLMRSFGVDALFVAFTYGPIMFFAGAAGILAGGILADRWRASGNKTAEIRVALVSALCLWPVSIATFQVDNVTYALILAIPTLFLSSFPFGAASSAIQLVTPNQLRARVSAIYLLIINIIGIGLGATVASAISDYVFADENRIGDGISIVALLSAPVAALLFWRSRETFKALQYS
jgi:MFS family permease